MSTRSTEAGYRGTSIFTLLAVLFIGLKLTHYIDWSWWWVLAPLWGGAALILVIVAVIMLFTIIGAVAKALLR